MLKKNILKIKLWLPLSTILLVLILVFVYPDPANNEFHLIIPGFDQEEKFVTIVDSYGKIVNLPKWENNITIFTINAESFNTGVYGVSISFNNGFSQTNKLVIIH